MYECSRCDRQFYTQHSRNQHQGALNHWPYECDGCYLRFPTEDDVEEHMNATGHWAHYCNECQRAFGNENNLRMHLNSSIHRGSTISCPFCRRNFVTASGVSHHLERNSCPNATGVNRATIYRAIRERDPHSVITKGQLEWHDWTPNMAWNGSDYECYICHRKFRSMQSLKQHLHSPAHQQELYHCPSRQCQKEFKTLASMFNHLESESCGFIRFEAVGEKVNGFLTGQRVIGF